MGHICRDMWKKTRITLRIFEKASWKRLLNAFLLLCSYYFSRMQGKSRVWAYPIALSVEPTTACNLKCPQCPSGLRNFSRPTGNLKIEDFTKWISPLKSKIWLMTFYFQGEPFIHPRICEAIRYAHQAGIYTISSTNGHFLNEHNCTSILSSGLDQLIISIDGSTQDVYEHYRIGGNLDQVLDGTKKLIELRKEKKQKTPWIVWQFIVFKSNEHQMDEIRRMARKYGVDEIRIKSAQIYKPETNSSFIPEQEVFSRYTSVQGGTFQIKNKLRNHCWRLWRAPVITWDGRVVPCCFDKDASHTMGALSEASFEEIWHGPAYQTFRNTLLASRKSIEICQNCSEGTKVWI